MMNEELLATWVLPLAFWVFLLVYAGVVSGGVDAFTKRGNDDAPPPRWVRWCWDLPAVVRPMGRLLVLMLAGGWFFLQLLGFALAAVARLLTRPRVGAAELLDPELIRKVRAEVATHSTVAVPVANFRTRLHRYHTSLRSFHRHMVTVAVTLAVLTFPCVYWAPAIGELFGIAGVVDRQPLWWLLALTVWAGGLVPWYAMLKPRRPTQADVIADVELRRRFGMNDAIEAD